MITIDNLVGEHSKMSLADAQVIRKKNKFEDDALRTITETARRYKRKPSEWLLGMIIMKSQRMADGIQVEDSAKDLAIYTFYFRYFLALNQ